MTDLTILRKTRWFTFRDAIILTLVGALGLLGVAVLQLTEQVDEFRKELSKRPTAAQFAQVQDQLQVKDARISQLTDTLVRNRIPVPAEPTPTPGRAPRPRLTPSPQGSPHPSPGRTSRPTARPSRTPSPSPTCLTVVAGTCVTPPPAPIPTVPLS